MIPIRDDQPRYSTPYVNYFIIGLNVLVYVLFEPPTQSRAFELMTLQFGLIPHDFTRALIGSAHYPLGANALTIMTSMFMHGSFFHLLGNMWFLWIFGDNIEDHLGHFSYMIFYLLCGIAAALTDIALTPTSDVPLIGASGAIAGVMGAYIVLYPRARVQTLVILIVFFTFWWLPAWFFLGYWFLLQFIATSVVATSAHHQTGGVAFAAHVGGFVIGLILIKLFPRRKYSQRYASW
jgi:membrane associated rhomboid family serine protease